MVRDRDPDLRPASAAAPRRHDLVLLSRAEWAAALASSPAPSRLGAEARALLAGWAGRGWPAVVRRPAGEDPPGALPLGVPLPPGLGGARVALHLAAGPPFAPCPAPDLAEARAAAPTGWGGTLDALDRLAATVGVVPRPFGALLWAAVTGLAYLRASSDLDLLWPVTAATDLDRLLDGLDAIDAAGPVPLDGEVLLPDGAGAHWRELRRARRTGGEVLFKTADGLSLRRADGLFPG